MQVTMMQNSQKNSKCVCEPAKAEHSLNRTTQPFVCDTMESVSGIIAYYLVVRDWCIIQRSGQHAGRLWLVKATAHCEVCDDLSRNASFYNTTGALETDKAQHLLQLIKNMQWRKNMVQSTTTTIKHTFMLHWLLYNEDVCYMLLSALLC